MFPGQNVYPAPDNYPDSSFKSPVPPPDVDPGEGDLLYVAYNPAWTEVLEGAAMQLMNPATWQGDHDDVITALNRSNNLMVLLQQPVAPPDETVDCPYWDDESDVDDEMNVDEQPWYGYVTNPDAPPDELDFVEDASIWALTGLLAVAIPVVGVAVAIAFRTIAPQMVVAVRKGDYGRIIRLYIDNFLVNTVVGDGTDTIVNVPVFGDPALESHQLLLIGMDA